MRATRDILCRDPDIGKRIRIVYARRRLYRLMGLTDDEKIETRRQCGYPAYGNSSAGFSSWRFFQSYGLLEYRIHNLADGELNVLRRHLSTLARLEAAIPGSADNLDTKSASVWVRNDAEVRDRERLYDNWRSRLCDFLGVPPGPGLRSSSPTLVV